MLNIKIGPYLAFQRTDYSKVRLTYLPTNEDLTETDSDILEDIMSDYKRQSKDPDAYFQLLSDCVFGLREKASDITYLFIPEGTIKIKDASLRRGNFTYIEIPESVFSIGRDAFEECRFLKEIDIPNTVKEIAMCAFVGCENLTHIKLPKKLEKICSKMFFNCVSLRDITIPETVRAISSCAFSNCTELKELILPPNLTVIDNYALSNCKKLSKIKLSASLKVIGQGCFKDCASIEEITIPDNVDIIYSGVFTGCTSLKTVKLNEGIEVIDTEAFSECCNLENIVLPDTVSRLGREVFSETEKLENINIPRDLKTIDAHPFGNSSIKSLTFNYDLDKLITVQNDLIGYSNVEKLIIDKNVKKITENAFKISGSQITTIDYLGTKEEFEVFKKENEKLFLHLDGIKEINFSDEQLSKNKDRDGNIR